jgi:hypothetical protein
MAQLPPIPYRSVHADINLREREREREQLLGFVGKIGPPQYAIQWATSQKHQHGKVQSLPSCQLSTENARSSHHPKPVIS